MRIYLKHMHEVRRMVATLREILMNRLFSKTSSSESIIARALNWVLRSFKLSFLRSKVNRNFLEVFQQKKTKTTIILLIANIELGKRIQSSIQKFAISKLQSIVLFWTVNNSCLNLISIISIILF